VASKKVFISFDYDNDKRCRYLHKSSFSKEDEATHILVITR